MSPVKRSWIAAIVLVAVACGDGTADDVAASSDGDGVAAVTAPGADSGFVDEGDQTPAESGDLSVVSVTVDLPADVELAGRAIVTLEDVTYSDIDAAEIARVELTAADLRTRGDTVDVVVPLPLDGTVDINAAVHLDVDESGTLSQGDWISSELAPVTAAAAGAVTVRVVQI